MSLEIVGLVGSAIKLLWNIWDKGFTKEKSSPQRWIEFGDALQRLHSNLTTIESIVKKANASLEADSISTFGPPKYDTRALTDIIGNFQLTLEECRELLNDETKFRQRGGFITNIIYNVNIDPQVIHLIDRLAFHNTKTCLVLDTFNIYVQRQLRDLHKEQHQDTAELLQELKQLLLSNREPATDVSSSLITRDLQVPIELSERFANELHRHVPSNLSESDGATIEAQISVKDGLEAFFSNFNGLSQDIDSMSYLRLMKSIWIMDRIRESDDWSKIQRTNPGGLYDRCVRAMDRRLRAECTRVAESKLPLPKLSIILQLPEDSFSIWPKVVSDKTPTQITHLGVLLDVPVLPDLKSHMLRIVRNVDGTLGVEDTTVTTTESTGTVSSERVVQKLNIDLKEAYLVPIYALPVDQDCNPPSSTIKLQSSRDGINGVTLEFKCTRDLSKLQHLVTGYRCVKQRNGIRLNSLIRGQNFPAVYAKGKPRSRKMPSDLTEYGNLQLWKKVPYEKSNPALEGILDAERSSSGASSLRPSGSSMSFSAPSIISNISSAHTQQISLGSSGKAIELTQPEPPLLVLFLKQQETGQLSFLVIELDERTKVEPNSCDCRSSKKSCTVSVLERSKTPLLARRFYARNGLNSWNLAAIGENWPSIESESVHVQDMYWLRITFVCESERTKFNTEVADLVRIFAARMEDYQKDLSLVRGTHIITKMS